MSFIILKNKGFCAILPADEEMAKAPENIIRKSYNSFLGGVVMKKAMVLGITLAFAALFVGGCSKGFNVFAPLTPAPKDLPASVSNAANAYAAGDYTGAMAMYKAVVDGDPSNSEARYGYVKAYVKSAGFDIATFIKNGTGNGSAPAFASRIAKGPILDDRYNPFGLNVKNLETLSVVIIYYLGPIADGQCSSFIPANDEGLNTSLAFAHLLYGIFLVVDKGFDGAIDYNFYDTGSGVNVVYWGTTNSVPAGRITNKTQAVAELDSAIKYLKVAILSAGSNSIWTDVLKFLTDARTEINTL